MLACIVVATVLGLFSGLAPGPYTTMVAATALERGFRVALPIAMVPLVTDLPPVVVTTFIVGQLDWAALTLLGIAGGVVIFMVGVRFLRAHHVSGLPQGEVDPGAAVGSNETGPATVRIGHVVLANVLNPSPWVFWFVLGAPLLLGQVQAGGPGRGILFVVTVFLVNVSSASALAWLASHGRRILAPANQRRVLVGAGLALTCAGGFMVWQALEGNFQSLVDGQLAVREALPG